MVEYNGQKGRWVTSNGRHIFISDDPTEKQEQEIKAQEEQTKKLTAEKQEEQEDFTSKERKEIGQIIDKFYHKGDNFYPDQLVDDVKYRFDMNGRKAPIRFVCASSVNDYLGDYEEDYTFDETDKKQYGREYYLFKTFDDGDGICVVVTENDFNE